mgnify:CR=1 FL=1
MVGTFFAASGPGAEPFVSMGQSVGVGDTLCIIEAMKMETQIRADREAVIDQVLVSRGAVVNAHDLLVTLKP